MNPPQLKFNGKESVSVSGELSFQTVPGLLAEHRDMFQGTKRLMLDLKDVERADSAGVALLIDWLRQAGQRHCELHFENIPSQMLAIAQVSGVEDLLVS